MWVWDAMTTKMDLIMKENGKIIKCTVRVFFSTGMGIDTMEIGRKENVRDRAGMYMLTGTNTIGNGNVKSIYLDDLKHGIGRFVSGGQKFEGEWYIFKKGFKV